MQAVVPPVPLRTVQAPHELEASDGGDDVRLGKQLQALRIVIGLSQRHVASLCKVDVSTVSRWERGLQSPLAHRSRNRGIRSAFEALRWAAELQEEDPTRVMTLEDIEEYVARRRKQRRGTGRL